MDKGVQTLSRAFDILELLALSRTGMGVTEISTRVGLHKSTAHRLLGALMSRGYVEKDATSTAYRIGLRVVELASLHLKSIELKTEAAPMLRRLLEQSGQTVHLATLIGDEVVYIEKLCAFGDIRMYSEIGKRVPAHCTGVGRALFLDVEREQLAARFAGYDFMPCTDNTRTSLRLFLDDMDAFRTLGYVIDNEEHEAGIRCVAAPIRDFTGAIIAAVSTTGPKAALPPEKDEEVSGWVLKCAADISRRMGYSR